MVRATWWPEGSGIPPDVGIALIEDAAGDADDPALRGLLALRALWVGRDSRSAALHEAVAELAVRLPRGDLPIWVVHGTEDGLVPTVFSSDPYVRWLREQGRSPCHWRVPHAQHFDAFLPLPGFGDRYVPLLAYGYEALDRLHAHLSGDAAPTDAPAPRPRPRGAGRLEKAHLGMPG